MGIDRIEAEPDNAALAARPARNAATKA